jgi:hypothetical protein
MPLKDDWAPNDTILSAMANAHADGINDLLARVAALEAGGGGGGGGAELAYAEATGAVNVTGTGPSTSNEVVAAPAVTLNGTTRVRVDFYAPGVAPNASSGAQLWILLYDGTTELGHWAETRNTAAAIMVVAVSATRYLTPSSGSHTFIARAYRTVGNGSISAGSGGAGVVPAFIRVTEA